MFTTFIKHMAYKFDAHYDCNLLPDFFARILDYNPKFK